MKAREVIAEFFRQGCHPSHRHAHFSSLKEADAILAALAREGLAVVPVSENDGEWWLIYFEDEELTPELYTDEQVARARYTTLLTNWACHLFRQVRPEGDGP